MFRFPVSSQAFTYLIDFNEAGLNNPDDSTTLAGGTAVYTTTHISPSGHFSFDAEITISTTTIATGAAAPLTVVSGTDLAMDQGVELSYPLAVETPC